MDDKTFYGIAVNLWARANDKASSPEEAIAIGKWAIEAKRRLDAAQNPAQPTAEANDGGDA